MKFLHGALYSLPPSASSKEDGANAPDPTASEERESELPCVNSPDHVSLSATCGGAPINEFCFCCWQFISHCWSQTLDAFVIINHYYYNAKSGMFEFGSG